MDMVDQLPPASVLVNAGDEIFVGNASGQTKAGVGFPYNQLSGPDGSPFYYQADNSPGNSGQGFPARYVDSSQKPAYLMALVGVFTSSSGVVVGQPFIVGFSSLVLTVPSGASQIQFGVNDDIFGDNSGSYTVEVSKVPEMGSTLVLLGDVLGLLARSLKGLASEFMCCP
jgi:hypothetical protein